MIFRIVSRHWRFQIQTQRCQTFFDDPFNVCENQLLPQKYDPEM